MPAPRTPKLIASFAALSFALHLMGAPRPEALPFATRVPGNAETLFEELPPAHTGITAINRYDDPRMWGDRYLEFTLGPFGTGIAIGDYDGDSRPDIFLTTKTGQNHLYRNLGEFRFEDVSAAAGVAGPADAWSQGATFADVNNDGRLDLYVCRFGAPNLLYINQGNGTFTEEAAARGLAVVDACGQASFADYDRDGHLDVFIQTNLLDIERAPTGQEDYLFRNNGDGTFTDTTAKARISGKAQGHSATWWDYDEDGWPDLYIANDFKDPDKLYRNNRDGTFTNDLSRALPHTPHSSMGADLNDVNNDGHIDLLVADMATPSRIKDHRGMAKVRAGLPDADNVPASAQQYMRNALYLNTGTGRMLEAACLTGLDATDWTWSVRLEDLDNDGWVDAFFTNGMIRELHNADLVTKMGTFESRGDRVRLMRQAPPLKENNMAFRNEGELRFSDVSKKWGLDHFGVSLGAAFGDLDNDGDLDLVVSHLDEAFSVYRNHSGGNAITFALQGTASNRFGAGAHIEIETDAGPQTRTLVLSRGYLSSDEPVLHFGLGETTLVKRAKVTWPSGAVQILEDLQANHRYTLHETPDENPPPPTQTLVPLFQENAEALGLGISVRDRQVNELQRQPLLTLRQNRVGPAAAVVDLEGDGRLDVVVGGATGESARALSNMGGSHMGFGLSGVPAGNELPDGPLLFFDANGDGHPDLLATKAGTAKPTGDKGYMPRLFHNEGSGRFVPAPTDAMPALALSVGAAAAADWDRDGDLDVFIGGRVTPGEYPKVPYSGLLVQEGGKFSLLDVEQSAGLADVGMVTSAIWSDADNDGWVDLVVCTDWGNVRFFRNDTGQRLVEETEARGFSSAGKGWWSSVASGDFNQDGFPDYALGNVGLNTVYRASQGAPATLLSGSFDGSGRQHLIEVTHFEGKRYPWRGLPQLGNSIPALARKFTSMDAYSKATLEEVFAAEALAQASSVTADQFQSGLLLSGPNGYTFRPFPRQAQLAPIHGMVVSDFDGDGHIDLAFVGNSFSPIPEIGRFDGGLGGLLLGDGKGALALSPALTSGLVVPGHAEALVLSDFDSNGWPDLFATRRIERCLAFLNAGVAGRSSFALKLIGPSGNPTAAGARVELRYNDGTSVTQELALGGTRLGQSIAALFFGYSDHNLPSSLLVRWPNGQTTTHPWPGQTALLEIQHP